ncbi:MAG: NAD(P)-binding domain-containing protein, partial [Arthrobacter sp.]
MGAPMAANLLTAGWNVTGWNRSPGAVRDLEALGGNAVSHVADLRDEPVII